MMNNSNNNAANLATARKGFVEATGVIRGAMRTYVASLCLALGNDWVEVLSSKSDNAKPLKASVEAERKELYAALTANGHTNPSVYWGRVKADVPLYLAEKALEEAKAKAEGKPAKSAAAKRAAAAADTVKALKEGVKAKRAPAGQPAAGEAPKGKGTGSAGITLVSANAFIMSALSAPESVALTPALRRGLANLAEAIAAYFAANPMDKLEAAIAAKK